MAGAVRKLGDGLVRWSEASLGHDPHAIAFARAFGQYFKTLPDRWATALPELQQFRREFPNMRVGDIPYQGGAFIASVGALAYTGYLMGLGNRTPISYRLTGWKEASDRITGWNGKSPEGPPQEYNTPLRFGKN
jgi:hypothetical protein